MILDHPDQRNRVVAGVAAVALQALIGYALFTGLTERIAMPSIASITVFDITPELPPRVAPVVPPRIKTGKRSGKAAPPNRTAKTAAIVAPPPVIVPVEPPPVVAALVAGTGSDADAGAAPQIGPGTGAGGTGSGTGSGISGDGDGDGGGTPSRWLRGSIRDADYPRAAYEAGVGGRVGLRFVVGTDGRVRECTILRSSGNAALDETTCRLIEQRRRYRPARDSEGRRIEEVYRGEHVWRYMGDQIPLKD